MQGHLMDLAPSGSPSFLLPHPCFSILSLCSFSADNSFGTPSSVNQALVVYSSGRSRSIRLRFNRAHWKDFFLEVAASLLGPIAFA